MSADAFAVGQLRSFIERVERVEEEIAVLNGDKSDIYKEIRSAGFDVKTVRKVVAKRKLADDVRDEQDSLFDTYWHALTGSTLVHVHTRENIQENPKSDGGAVAAVKGKARLANAAGVEPPPSEHSEATQTATNEGGANPEEDMAQGSTPDLEPSGPEAERATSFTARPPTPLRPHCRQPEACGGYGRNHCHTCAKAMREREPQEELA
ncbi:DUF2312 domain-containing protein [Ensifer sp. LBL]|uniref:DUF2312 domain-containing protein n=1 Tax=Ensifer sp. LBL TaxID=2991056 RepID=UPI003D1D074A